MTTELNVHTNSLVEKYLGKKKERKKKERKKKKEKKENKDGQ